MLMDTERCSILVEAVEIEHEVMENLIGCQIGGFRFIWPVNVRPIQNQKSGLNLIRKSFQSVSLREASVGRFAMETIIATAEFDHGDTPKSWVAFIAARRNGAFLSHIKTILNIEKRGNVCKLIPTYVRSTVIHCKGPNGRIHDLHGSER